MTNPHPVSISRISWRAASIALAFAVVLGVLPTQSAQAQTFTVLHAFQGAPDGAWPVAGLLLDPKGNLYGTTTTGGDGSCNHFPPPPGCGVVFKIDTAGKESVLYRFGHGHGQNPLAGLVRDAKGNLYGTTNVGGHFSRGTAFKVTPTGQQTVLHAFDKGVGGSYPRARVVRDSLGNLYGTTETGGNSTGSGVVFKLNKFGREKVLYTFSCYVCNGQSGGGFGFPFSGGVIRDSAGNFYGTASGGTMNDQCKTGCGVVYKVDKAGVGVALYSFTGGNNDGLAPSGNLIMDAAGNLYGTTQAGGGNGCGNSFGCGTVFKVDPSGHETLLYRFADKLDGAYPTGGLVRDPQGNLYGTTQMGGDPTCDGGFGCGVVFKIDPSGTETTLYAFTGGTDGEFPNPDLIRDAPGNLYGTTLDGGDQTCARKTGCGVVFKIAP